MGRRWAHALCFVSPPTWTLCCETQSVWSWSTQLSFPQVQKHSSEGNKQVRWCKGVSGPLWIILADKVKTEKCAYLFWPSTEPRGKVYWGKVPTGFLERTQIGLICKQLQNIAISWTLFCWSQRTFTGTACKVKIVSPGNWASVLSPPLISDWKHVDLCSSVQWLQLVQMYPISSHLCPLPPGTDSNCALTARNTAWANYPSILSAFWSAFAPCPEFSVATATLLALPELMSSSSMFTWALVTWVTFPVCPPELPSSHYVLCSLPSRWAAAQLGDGRRRKAYSLYCPHWWDYGWWDKTSRHLFCKVHTQAQTGFWFVLAKMDFKVGKTVLVSLCRKRRAEA